MTSRELEALIGLLGGYQTSRDAPIAHRRQRFEDLMDKFPAAEGVTIASSETNGIPIAWITAPAVSDDLTVFYIHGGGFLFGSPRSHRDLCARVSAAVSAPVLVTSYRLAPEHRFPAALDDVGASYRWLLDQDTRGEQIVIAGDSAGACLALALIVKLRDTGDQLPAGGVLISPWIDLTQPEDWVEVSKVYAGDADLRDPLVSPYFGDLTGLPPLLIQVGTNEPLLDQARRLAEKAQAQGVAVHYEAWDGMIHNWPLFASKLCEGREAIDQIAAFCRDI